jgi:hypothetical protein
MAKPVNAMTGDAPDGQNPNKKYVPEKQGRFKYTPPPPPKPDPRDAEIFTEEKLRRSGGKMKEPPMGLDSKKRGGVIKRRFASGGEIMDVEPVNETEASDKAAGLKASKGEDVGFFKRLMMGNIDKPGSEAYEKFGAGRGRVANIPAAEERQAIKRKPDEGFEPSEPVRPPSPRIDIDDMKRAQDYAKDVGGPSADKEKAQSYADEFGGSSSSSKVKPTVNKPTPVKAPQKDTVRKDDVSPQAETKYPGQGREATGKPTAVRDYKTGEKAEEDYKRISKPGRDAIEGFYPEEFLIPGGKAIKYGLNALKGGAKAAEVGSASRALTPYETPVTFLGKGSAKNITPVERLGTEQAKRLTYQEAQGAVSGATPRVGGPRTAAQKDAAEFMASLKGPKTGGSSGPKGKNPFNAAKDKSPRKKSSFKETDDYNDFNRGGNVKRYASGGSVSASSRGDGCAQRGKTRGMMR